MCNDIEQLVRKVIAIMNKEKRSTCRISTTISSDAKRKLEQKAKKNGMSMSTYIQFLIYKQLNVQL